MTARNLFQTLLLGSILLFVSSSLCAQVAFDLGNYHITPPDNMCKLRWGRKKAIAALGQPFNGLYYLMAQFKEIPDAHAQQRMAEAGLRLGDYIAQNTYFVTLRQEGLKKSLKEKNLISLFPIQWEWKVAAPLLSENVPEFARRGTSIGISVVYHEYFSTTWVTARLKELGFEQELHIAGKPFCNFELWVSPEQLKILAQEPWVKMIGMVSPPAVLY